MRVPGSGRRILPATRPVDFRKGRGGLAPLARNELRKGVFTGMAFVFRAKGPGRMKLIFRDGTGLAMICKRLDKTRFARPAPPRSRP